MSAYKGFTIRTRTRRCASPKAGMRSVSIEVQVVQGRRILARFDKTIKDERS